MKTLSQAQAKRIAIAAQGLDNGRPAKATRAHIRRTLKRQGLLQIDSVNVLARAHYVPLFSRLGTYDRDLLDKMAYRDRELFEYWGHEASLIDIEMFPLLRHRMRPHGHPRMQAWIGRHSALVDEILAAVQERGPLGISDLTEHRERGDPWWGWSNAKMALEHLLLIGRVAVHSRRNFERLYDITERVIPERVRVEQLDEAEAKKRLLLHGAAALGVGTAADIADYWRVHKPTARPLIVELAADGALIPVRVEGWKDQAFVHPGAKSPRSVHAHALLSPFDPLVWERSRAHRLFDFHYRIEIYTPEPKRTYGYYVLPFVFGEDIVARVDLKADRGTGTLLVQAAWLEPVAKDPRAVARALAQELQTAASWLGLEQIVAKTKGTLAKHLRAAL